MLPELKPRAMRQHLIAPSIGGRDVSCTEWSNVRRVEHFLDLLNFVNDAFDVHGSQYLTQVRGGKPHFCCVQYANQYHCARVQQRD